jgi:hypothetical protein
MSTLTKEQEEKIENYYQQCLKNGIAVNKEIKIDEVKDYIHKLYTKYLDINPPKEIIIVDSPEAAIKLALEDAENENMSRKDIVDAILFANQIRHWVAYYFAGVEILKEDLESALKTELYELETFCTKFHAILPASDVAVLIKFPVKCEIKDNDLDKFVLHCEDDFAIKYADGTGYGYLNGIKVDDYIATTPKEELDVFKVLKVENVDSRREGLLKIGPERVAKELSKDAKVLDTQGGDELWNDYALIEVDFGNDLKAKCLKMFCVSRDAYIYEFVADDCKTVKEALIFRDPDTNEDIPCVEVL